MSGAVQIPEEVQQFIEKIIADNDLEKSAEIKYGPGSELGDGYTSKTFTVDISDGKKSLSLFLKLPLRMIWHENLPMKKFFENEIYFYGTIYPAYLKFLKEHGVDDTYINVSKCYGIYDNIIALENLKHKNFCMFSRGKVINDAHFVYALKTFAKFHAISFAFKDQKKELYNTFLANIQNCARETSIAANFDKLLSFGVHEFLKTLDTVEDKYILDVSNNLAENLVDIMLNIEYQANEYSAIMQGDTWTNNVMYLYEEGNQDDPIDMMLIDWQLVRNGSPAIDLCYFFYPISSEPTLENLEYYMKVYHEELSMRIKQLGSDPDVLYPYAQFKEEWKRFSRFGLAMTFFMLKSLLLEKDEMPNMEDYPELFQKILSDDEEVHKTLPKMKNEKLYQSRLKTIVKHFIDNDFLR